MYRSLIAALVFTVAASAAPIFLSVNNNNENNNRLVSLDVANGALTDIGGLGLTNVDIEGMALNPLTYQLLGIDDNQERLIRIDPATGAGTVVSTFSFAVDDVGLAFSPSGVLYFSNVRAGDTQPELYTVNPVTGAATLVGPLAQKVNGLAFFGTTLYGLGNTQLLSINPATGAITIVGNLGRTVLDGELAFDSAGNGFAVRDLAPDNSGVTELFQINRLTGAASGSILLGSAGSPVTLEALTQTVPEPGTVALVPLALLGVAAARWRHARRNSA